MNNWCLLLLAVVAVLQPSGSFTETNLIDGRQGCCDRQTRSASQETNLYGNYRKATPEDRRLNSLPVREESRRLQARSDPIVRSRERLAVERTERRVVPDSTARFSTEARFARDQERRQRLLEARNTAEIREDRSRRTREHVSRDSLTRYERDALDSRRVRMSRVDTRIGRDTTRVVRDGEEYRRDSANRETIILQRNRNNVARDEVRRDSRIDTFQSGNRVQDNNERRSFDRRARESVEEMRRSRSAESRPNRVYTDTRRSTKMAVSKRVDDRRRESRDTALNQRDSTRMSRDSIDRQDQRRVVRENRLNEMARESRQERVESRMSRESSSELRESRPVAERRLARQSPVQNVNVRLVRSEKSNDNTETRREIARNLERVSRDMTNKRTLSSRAREATRVLTVMRTDETREDRRQPLTRSLDREVVRSTDRRTNEREVRISDRSVRDERAARNRREVRSMERLDERREQRQESRMSRERQLELRESRDSSERRQETRRTVSPYRVEVNARLERESRLREIRDNKRSDVNREREERSREHASSRLTRDTERRDDSRLSRNSRATERTSDERMSRIRDDVRGERFDVRRETNDARRARVVEARRLAREISESTERRDTRRTSRVAESESRLQRARTLEDIRDERREVREQDENRMARDRVSMSRLARERNDNEDRVRETRDARIDTRYETIRNREARMERFEARDNSERRSRDLVLQRLNRDGLATRSAERRSREATRENRAERLSINRDERRVSERDARNIRDVRTEESRRDNRMMDRQAQPMERIYRVNRESNDDRFEAKLRSTDASRLNTNTRREIETRFRNLAAKVREVDSVDETYGQGIMSWQMVFYTLQGAYLCGLLMQMLSEKSNKGKTRNFAWWSSAKHLIKVD